MLLGPLCSLTTPVRSKVVVDQFYGLGAVLSPVDGEVRPPSGFTERTDRYPRKEWWSYLISIADWSPSQRQLMRAEVLRRISFPRIRDPLRLTGRYPGHQLRSEESKSVEFLESARREFRVAEAILNDPVRHQSRLVPSPTMRQGYRLQRPSAVVPQTTDSRPRLPAERETVGPTPRFLSYSARLPAQKLFRSSAVLEPRIRAGFQGIWLTSA